ncbi:MAG: RNA polymerase sigma factor [Geitlerinemataceae cyanobacterium]
MDIPKFSEANHPIVKALFHQSDTDLLALYQQKPEEGKYFTAIFCRYSAIVYTLVRHMAKSPVQADYLFASIWRHVFHEMRSLDLQSREDGQSTLQNWLIDVTAQAINQSELPPVESIHYSLDTAPPPLWCYLQQALDVLSPLSRLIVVMSQTFRWSETRIAAYLQAEGSAISAAEVARRLPTAIAQLEDTLPKDICEIYLGVEAA